jgi:protein-disulfide isomerase-like protein with CxxC motif
MELIYIYDTYCGWCNISRDNITQLYDKTKEKYQWKFLHLNLFNNSNIITINDDFLKMVEQVGLKIAIEKGGRTFAKEYFDLLRNPDFIHKSDISALAVASIELINKEVLIPYAFTLQEELFHKGKNITKDLAIQIATNFNIDKDLFIKTIDSKQSNDLRNSNLFSAKKYLIKAHKSGVPTLLLNNNDKLTTLDAHNTHDI